MASSKLVTAALAVVIAYVATNYQTMKEALLLSGSLTWDDLASSRLLELLAYALTAHAILGLGVGAIPVNIPIKKPMMKFLARTGRAVKMFWIVAAGAAMGMVLAAAEACRADADEVRFQRWVLFAVCQLYVLSYVRANERSEVEMLLDLEHAMMRKEMLNWKPPPREVGIYAPAFLQNTFQPKFLGEEQLPKTRKILFVMNHQMGGMEIPLFCEHMHVVHDLHPRSLADHFHFYLPGWAHMLRSAGAIDGTRENCQAVMEHGQPVLVFPGGGNEVLKSKHDAKYELKWKERTGFARMAMANGYTIVPVASVGLEDQIDVIADIPVGDLLGKLGVWSSESRKAMVLPVMKPRTSQLGQRIYFRFLEPIDTVQHGAPDAAADKDAVRAVRDLCKERLEAGLKALLTEREKDSDRFLR